MRMSATYDPADNKLRLSAAQRLDADTYARVKAAGFSWAPKQGIFVAPAWSPQREDLLLELTARCQECGGDDALPEPGDEGIPICSECGGNFAGEIGDEDTTLVDRAEQRAERFENYSEKREADAERAHAAVSRIADNIPLGQPILVGHHSERHARKDAARIENGMRRAVKMWETSQYWEARAAGALHHAKYKERPDVRFRRIKGIEADKRKAEKATADALQFIALWQADDLKWYQARAIANHDHVHECFPLADYPRTAICMECDFPMGERETCGRVRVLVHRETKERTEVACTGQSKSASTYEGSMGLWSALAGSLHAEIPTLSRWLARRVPEAFRRQPARVVDEPGHWDSSYGPDAYVAERTRQRLLIVRSAETREPATSSGFYYSYDVLTDTPGVAIDRRGGVYSIDESGSAAIGQYAAHPSTDDRDLHTSYDVMTAPSLSDMRDVAGLLRTMHEALTCDDPAAYLTDEDSDVQLAALRNPRVTADQIRAAMKTMTKRIKATATKTLARIENAA